MALGSTLAAIGSGASSAGAAQLGGSSAAGPSATTAPLQLGEEFALRTTARDWVYAPHVGRFILPTHARSRGRQLATWYGPGLWGNGMGCGGTLRRTTWGIAHRTLPCGTLVQISYGTRKVAVRVVDRGPYSGATVDLTRRTSDFLRFTSAGTGHVNMTVVSRYR